MGGRGRDGGRVTVLGERWLVGLALLVWGLGVLLSGMGLDHTPIGRIFGLYWPLPFVLYGLVGIVYHTAARRGSALFSVLVTVVAGAILGSHFYHGPINGWDLLWALLLVAAGAALLGQGSWVGTVSGGVGSLRRGGRGSGSARHVHHVLGDVRLDLSDVDVPEGETPLEVSSVLGDITLLVPRNLAISVIAEVTLGDVRVFGEHAEGIYPRLTYETPGYPEAPRRLAVYAHLVMGDVTVKPF